MKNVVVFMNTDRVGGAERSMLLQLISQSNNQYHFMIPSVSGSRELEDLIKSHGFSRITYFKYPKELYGLSRSSLKMSIGLAVDGIKILFQKDMQEIIKTADVIYLNGLKAAFYYLLKTRFHKIDKKVVLHVRDYWQAGALTSWVWKSVNSIKPENLLIVCNSNSTLQSLMNSPFSRYEKVVIYNPSGLPVRQNEKRPIKTLGFVSMLAPWKGIHEIILWAKMYEVELANLGIERINFYGADLYLTHGAHTGYAKQLQQLVNKLSPRLVHFKGMREPHEIFSEIDCLIHYSLEAEPFGRVLIEAFHNGVPSISTCLGGASELIEERATGMSTIKYDLNGLMNCVALIVKDDIFRSEIVDNAMKRSIEIEKTIKSKMNRVFEEARTG